MSTADAFGGRVVVVGSANMDVTAQVPVLPEPGQTLLAKDVAFRPGGKGANQAVAACRAGAETDLYAAVGADSFGRLLRDALRDNGVGLDHLVEAGRETTGLALVAVAADAENTIIVAPGANFALTAADVRELAVRAGDVVLLQLEISVPTAVAAATAARGAGARVVLNAAPLSAADALGDLLTTVDVLVVNETEARALASVPPPADPVGWIDVAAGLRRLGPAAVVVTLGGDGAVGYDADGGWHRPAVPAAVVDTTGAGDAFCGALVAALAAGRTLRRAVHRGCVAGAVATERYGAQTAPTRDELDERTGDET
ncbi:MAG TPA: ribokinase [Actinocatenispora sp.]